MKRSVRLDRLPADLQFPAELAGKISYDAGRQQLEFDGFMSKTDFDKLVCLHNDLAYQRSLERLFQQCTFTPATVAAPPRRYPLLYAGIATAAGAMTALFFLLWH